MHVINHSMRELHLYGMCMIVVCHCMCILGGSSSCRKIQLLGIAHPILGISISGAGGMTGDKTHPRPQL